MSRITSFDRQAEATRLLRSAYSTLGRTAVEALLPAPFKVILCSHDTGCQPKIAMKIDGHPTFYVWEGSIWYSSVYDFNDRDKVLGMKPQAAFAEPIVRTFFEALAPMIAAKEAERVALLARSRLEQVQQQHSTINAYAAVVAKMQSAA